jgi:hypothetical protein
MINVVRDTSDEREQRARNEQRHAGRCESAEMSDVKID